MEIKEHATIGEAYKPAMEITDQAVADEYFEALVKSCMKDDPSFSIVQAEELQRHNLGYYAGYYDNETRARVEALFHCAHPIFGAIAEKGIPTPKEAFELGEKFFNELSKE